MARATTGTPGIRAGDMYRALLARTCRASKYRRGVQEERIEIEGIPARLYAARDAPALLLLGHGGTHSKDGPRFVRLCRTYAEHTGLAVVCIDAVDHGERKRPSVSADIPKQWHSSNVDQMVDD